MKTTSWRCSRYAQLVRPQSFRSLGISSSSSKLPTRKREDHQLKDIVPGDLTATLEAHRVSNRIPFRRVVESQPNASDDGTEATSSTNVPESEDVNSSSTTPETIAQPAKDSDNSPKTTSAAISGEARKNNDGLVTRVASFMAKGEVSKLRKRVLQLAPASGALDNDDVESVIRTVKVNLAKSRDASDAGRNKGFSHDKRQGDDDKYKKGSYVQIPRSSDLREPMRPWAVVDRSLQQDRDRLLSAQMLNLSDWLTLTPTESAFRTALAFDLSNGLRKQLEDIGFWLFGSHETGLATVLSDIDIGFYLPSLVKKPGERGPSSGFGLRSNRVKITNALDSIFISSIWTKRFEDPMIVWARYPLVHMTHAGSRAKIQVVASQPTRVVNEYIRDCLAEHRQLRPIYFLLKTSLAARGLDEPRHGGLGSYTLLNIIIIALKARKVPRRDSVATALHKVLLYITEIDTHKTGLTTEPPYKFRKRDSHEIISAKSKQDIETDSVAWARNQINVKNAKQDFLLCLQDPNDPLNDLGKQAYQILAIRATLSKFKHAMEAWLSMKEIVTVKRTGRPQGPEQLMDWMIGKMCNTVQDRRDLFNEWQASGAGRIELEQMTGRLKEAEGLTDTTETLQGGGPRAPSDQGDDLEKAVDGLIGSSSEQEEDLTRL